MQNNHRTTGSTRQQLTEAALCAWVGQAATGEQLTYHRGFLAIDVGPESQVLTPAEKQQLRCVAARAYRLFNEGLVSLVQRREAQGEYTYILITRARPRTSTGALRAVLEQAGLSEAPVSIAARRSA